MLQAGRRMSWCGRSRRGDRWTPPDGAAREVDNGRSPRPQQVRAPSLPTPCMTAVAAGWHAVSVVEGEYRGQFPLDVTVVPARAVYLVREDSRDGFRRAVQEASTRWAGVTEPIVPVSPGGVIEDSVRKIVDLARVDGAINVDLPDDEAVLAAAVLGLDWVPLADIDRGGVTMWTCHPGWVGPAAPRDPALVIAGQSGELWQAVAAGDLTTEHLAAADPAVLSVRRGGTPDDVGRSQLVSATLLNRTLVAFGETYGSQAPGAAPTVVWVTEPDNLRDCWEFWNIRALSPIRFGTLPMILLPRGEIQHWIKFDQQFAHTLHRGAEFTPDVLLASANLPDAELDTIAELLHLERTDEEIRRGHSYPASIRKAPFTYRILRNLGPFISFRRLYGTSTQVDVHVFDSGTTARFESPVEFRAGSTLMRFGGVPFRGLPRRPVVAKLVHANATWREDAIQLCVQAMEHYTFQIQVPSLQQATHALLAEAAARHELSDKGRLATGIQRNIDTATLRQPHVFKVIRQLTTPRTKQFLDEVRRQFKGDDAAIEKLQPLAGEWGGKSERRMLSVSSLRGGATPDNVATLELLCSIGWAERGLRIKCTECRVDTFVPLNDVATRSSATCPGCGSQQNYASGASEVSIFYRLNSLVDRASDQGVIPHLLAIAELSRRDPQSWFLPGVNVWFADGSQKEADIFGVHDSKVVVGEVKTSGSEFTDSELTKDVDVCKRLGADSFVMAATDSLADDTRARAKELCDTAGLELIVLNGSDLLPGD
jgi:hypothetical protein